MIGQSASSVALRPPFIRDLRVPPLTGCNGVIKKKGRDTIPATAKSLCSLFRVDASIVQHRFYPGFHVVSVVLKIYWQSLPDVLRHCEWVAYSGKRGRRVDHTEVWQVSRKISL